MKFSDRLRHFWRSYDIISFWRDVIFHVFETPFIYKQWRTIEKMGTIDFRFFLGAIKKYYNFRYTDQIWWDNHHFSPFYGWFLLFEIYGHYIGFRRGAPSQNWNIFRTDARMTPQIFRNASNKLLWKVWKFHMASDYRFWVIQNQKNRGGRFVPPPVWSRVKPHWE